MPLNEVAKEANFTDLLIEYDEKVEGIPALINNYGIACNAFNMGTTIRGTFAETVLKTNTPHESSIKRNLLISAWRAVYNRLNIDVLVTADDKKKFERLFSDPPAFNAENAKEVFGDYLMRPRYHILRGLAEVFSNLDSAYKSHSKVLIGVQGLPKRVVLSGFTGFGDSYAYDRFMNVCNALAVYQGIKKIDHQEARILDYVFRNLFGEDTHFDGRTYIQKSRYENQEPTEYKTIDRGISVKRFKNGNAHLIFNKKSLLDINRALAEFYGEVLPDAEEEGVKPSTSTAVAKDLQYYATPEPVINRMFDFGYVRKDDYVLEPSCGDGRILDAIRDMGARSLGIEYHGDRLLASRNKGHKVLLANFLEQPPEPIFDKVMMNPPFYGKHYVKHVEHALKFLKPGGVLVSVLPASARYDHKILEGDWVDLPVASFSDSGTNIPTVLLKIRK